MKTKIALKLLSLILYTMILSCQKDSTNIIEPDSNEIDIVIQKVNEDIQSSKLAVSKLTKEHFNIWFAEFVQFGPLKQDRQNMLEAVSNGDLPIGCSITLQDNSEDNLPSSIIFNPYNLPIIEGNNILSYLKWLENMLIASSGNLELIQEPFQGSLPFVNTLSEDILIRITEIEVEGTCLVPGYEERDALKIEVLINTQNNEMISSWFGIGFNKEEMQNTIAQLLGSENEVWIDVKELLPNWLKNRINTFPVEGDNEVCHGAAREFYYVEQEASLNASTEATTLMLSNYYCTKTDISNLVFGDYLYVPGQHSGRYLLKDPDSGRHIVFSVQSGGIGAYRFWWMNEDFSGNPFGHKAVDSLLTTRIDVYRRCKE